jgi:adenylate kinase family enzyme
VIELQVDEDALVDRITGRFTCASAARLSRRFKLPKVEGTCDVCGSHEFKRRPDDNAETVRTRMAEYRAKTAPILPFYEARGLVRRSTAWPTWTRSARRSRDPRRQGLNAIASRQKGGFACASLYSCCP